MQRIRDAWAQGDIGDFDDEVQGLRDDLNNGDKHGGDHGGDHGDGHGDGQGNMDDSVRNAIDTIIGELLDAAGGQ